jgi:aryl-alcohol dehydrogenase-like predicted oxidoreductase
LELRKLGTSDLNVSSIALGCVTFGREIDADTSFAVLDRAMDCGINLLDTAAVYGNGASETVLGQWLKTRRLHDQVIVATKVSGRLTSEAVRHSVQGSLRRLGIERIDLLQAHDWDSQTPVEETLEAFDVVVREGKVRYVGCSNWDAGQIRHSLEIQASRDWAHLSSVQPMYNLADRSIEHNLLALCAERQMGVITYSPLGAGFLTGKYRPGRAVPGGTRFDVIPGHQDIYFTERGFRIVEELEQISFESGHSMVKLAIGWVLCQNGVTSVLIGARRPEHVEQAFEAEEWARSDAAQQWLDRLTKVSEMDSPPVPMEAGRRKTRRLGEG